MSVVRSALASRAARRGVIRRRRAAERVARDPFGQFLDPLRLVAIAAELLVEDERVQPIEPRLERRSCDPLPRRTSRRAAARVTTRSAFFAISALVVRLRVDDREERFLQLAVVGHHRKVVLMMHERRRQHFVRQLEEAALEEAGDDARELDEVGDLVDQSAACSLSCTRPPSCRAWFSSSRAIRSRRSDVIEDDEVLRQPRPVLVEGPHLDRPSGASARGEEPMAVGDRAGLVPPAPAGRRVRRRGRW